MAGHPLEAATAAALTEYNSMKSEISKLRTELRGSEDREKILHGKIMSLEAELDSSKARSDHYLRWNCEITKQMHNIGMFVDDALKLAHIEIAKSNSGKQIEALDAVEKAITDATQPIQHQDRQRIIPNN